MRALTTGSKTHTLTSMIMDRIPGLAELSDEEKWRVIVELEEDLITRDSTMDEPFRSELRSLLESRLEAHHANPEAAVTVDQARARLREWKANRRSDHA